MIETMSKNNELAKNEIRETQKERDSLMRWKLILVSAIGAAALGFSRGSPLPNAELALCLIPFTCVYVDLLCRNLSIRTKMISIFLAQKQNDPLERFYQDYIVARRSSLESLALRGSTLLLSTLMVPIGVISHSSDPSDLVATWCSWSSFLFYLSGLSGIIVSLMVEIRYQEQKNALPKFEVSADATKGDE